MPRQIVRPSSSAESVSQNLTRNEWVLGSSGCIARSRGDLCAAKMRPFLMHRQVRWSHYNRGVSPERLSNVCGSVLPLVSLLNRPDTFQGLFDRLDFMCELALQITEQCAQAFQTLYGLRQR